MPGSYVGLAGLSIPIGLTVSGLPVGLELDNVEGSDETVLGIGLSIGHVSDAARSSDTLAIEYT